MGDKWRCSFMFMSLEGVKQSHVTQRTQARARRAHPLGNTSPGHFILLQSKWAADFSVQEQQSSIGRLHGMTGNQAAACT